jgi:hypothetical protein
MSELSDNLRKSTEAMATGCTAHPDLWNTHANNCLAAASEIERMETLCGHIVELLRTVNPFSK